MYALHSCVVTSQHAISSAVTESLHAAQMVQRQEAAIPDLSGLGSQLGDLDKRLVKDLEVVPDKIGTMKRYAW